MRIDKLKELRDLANIPRNYGEQWIDIRLNINGLFNEGHESGTINFSFNWKCNMGECDFRSLEHAIEEVIQLRKYANLIEDKYD